MKPSIYLGRGTAVAAALLSSGSFAGALSQAEVQQLGSGTSHPYIVIMKNQLSGADAIGDQAPVVNELKQVAAQRVKQFRTVNSLAATVTEAEAEHLKSNPSVPVYRVVRREGPDHAPRFEVEVGLIGHEPVVGAGGSKREAEQDAAKKMLMKLGLS